MLLAAQKDHIGGRPMIWKQYAYAALGRACIAQKKQKSL
jgi:hypothetical protein